MLKGINSNSIILVLLAMVISCSASRSTAIHTTIVQDSTIIKKLDSVPVSELKPQEKQLKQEISKTVKIQQSTAKTNDAVVNALDAQSAMLVEIFNMNVSYRAQLDSLRVMSERKDKALNGYREYLSNIEKHNREAEEIGRGLVEQLNTVPKIFVTILVTLLVIAGVILWVHRSISKQLKRAKENA